MAGEWSAQLAAVVGAIAGSILTLIALGGRRRASSRGLEESRRAIIEELREIEGLLDPSRRTPGTRDGSGGGPRPEPIRMVQSTDEATKQEAA